MSVSTPDAPIEQTAVIGVRDTHARAEQLIRELEAEGIAMHKLSIVAKGYHTEEQPVGYYTLYDRFKRWLGLGTAWGALWGTVFGILFFWLPDFGPIYVEDPFLNLAVVMLEGAAIGAVVGTGATILSGIGAPRRRRIKYVTQLRADKYLVLAHGTPAEIRQARRLIEQQDTAHRDTVTA
ncbi:MAG: permease [Gammaproteobacteria bacterium]|nr:permease [Gammaproteobacteria bacterium]